MKITVKDFADSINADCMVRRYFWVCGLVKETINLWKILAHYELLCDEGQMMAKHYIAEREQGELR